MERWQKEYITDNLLELIENTICTPSFLSSLKSKKILGRADLETLDTTEKIKGTLAQSRRLYELLETRTRAFEALIEALHSTNQTGARNLLLSGYIKQGTYPPFQFADNLLSWNSSHVSKTDLQHILLSQRVIVQGQEMQLKDACKDIPQKCLNEIMERTIDQSTMIAIMNTENRFKLIDDTFPDLPSYYIPRTLTGRNRILPTALQENGHDIFIVKGTNLEFLTSLVSSNIAVESGQLLDRLGSVRHILCENDEDFNIICQASGLQANIHLVEFQNEKLYWIQTHGKIGRLQEFIDDEQDSLEDKDEALAKYFLQDSVRNCPICITDTPGMGKTMLLAKVAKDIQKIETNAFVLFFTLLEFVQHIPPRLKQINKGTVEDAIATMATATTENNRFGKEIILYFLQSLEKRVEIFFDGFDEILGRHKDSAKKVLKVLNDEFMNTRVHVTTRPHMRQELEETLCVLGYNISPFQETDQINFLVNFWTSLLPAIPSMSIDQHALEEFAKLCLATMKGKMSDDERDIAGVPMQCRLLGEIYQTQAERRLKSKDEQSEPLVTSIFQMYSKLMDLRFEKVHDEQNFKDSSTFGTSKFLRRALKQKDLIRKIKEAHYIAAIELLFPEFSDSIKAVLEPDQNKYIGRYLYSLGVIEVKATPASKHAFLHRTYGEFFVALFIVDVLTSKYPKSKDKLFWNSFFPFLFKTIFKTQEKLEEMLAHPINGIKSTINIATFDNSAIAYFINGHLSNHILNDLKLEKLSYLLCPMNLGNEVYFSTFMSCAVSNLENLLKLLLMLYKNITPDTVSLPIELLIASAKYSDHEFNKYIHSFCSDNTEITFPEGDKQNLVTPLHAAIQRGNHSVIHTLLNRYMPSCIDLNLLRVCLSGSSFDNIDTVQRKVEIVKLIMKHAPYLRDVKIGKDGATPILLPNTHFELIQSLLNHGANVNAVTSNNDSVLHTFLKGRRKETIREEVVIEFIELVKRYGFTKYNLANKTGETPLSIAMGTASVAKRLLKSFEEQQADFSYINSDGESLLFLAIQSQQSVECLEQLRVYGVDINAVNLSLETLMHKAAEVGDVEALTVLLRWSKVLIRCKDMNGNTPLHIAFSKDTNVHMEIQDILLRHGADFLTQNEQGQIPVEYGLQYSNSLKITKERLISLEQFGFQNPKENATRLLRSLLLNISSISWDIEGEYRQLLLHLISIGGRVPGEGDEVLIENKTIQFCVLQIAQNLKSIYFPDIPEGEAENIFELLLNNKISESDREMIMQLDCNDMSVELVILILLCLKDRVSFRLLQKAYQLSQSKSRFKLRRLDSFVKKWARVYHRLFTVNC